MELAVALVVAGGPRTSRVGRFSEGIARLPETAATIRVGRFSDGTTA
jgi:hypothetical protein